MLALSAQNARRVGAAVAALAGTPGCVWCGLTHFAAAGHLKHPPYPAWEIGLEIMWVGFFILAAVLALLSNMRGRVAFFGLLLFAAVLQPGLGAGMFEFVVPTPVLIVGFAIWALRYQAPIDYRGRCLECGYDLTGNVSGVCPECATPVYARPSSHHSTAGSLL